MRRLSYPRDPTAPLCDIQRLQIDPADGNVTFGWLDKAQQQTCQRTFPTAAAAYDGDMLSLSNPRLMPFKAGRSP